MFNLFQNATVTSPAVWHCSDCSRQHGMVRYNPFLEVLSSQDGDDIEWGESADIFKMSEALQNCKAFETVNEFNRDFYRTFKENNKSPFSVFFNNLDGNYTNFDNIAVDIKKFKHKLSAIALCETNIESDHKSLYNLEGYDSIYQSKLPNKSKGSGLALYIDDNLLYEEVPDLCVCTPDIESLFVKIANGDEPITLGVVYRSPSGNFNEFITNFENLLEALPKNNVYITGDFNLF